MDNLYLRERCSSILDRFIDTLLPRIRYDRNRKVGILCELAQKIHEKTQKKSEDANAGRILKNTSVGGVFGGVIGRVVGGVIAGGLFTPLATLGGALLGGLGSKLAASITADNSSEIQERIDDNAWNTLLTNPELSINLIKDHIIYTLYPKRLCYEDVEIMMALVDSPTRPVIETVNCDLGIVSELELYTGGSCISKDLTKFDEELDNYRHSYDGTTSGRASLKIVFYQNIIYDDLKSQPRINLIRDVMSLYPQILALGAQDHLIAIVPKPMMYNPSFQEYRKIWITSGRLKAIMELKQPPHNGQIELCAMVFSGRKSEKILLSPSNWKPGLFSALELRMCLQRNIEKADTRSRLQHNSLYEYDSSHTNLRDSLSSRLQSLPIGWQTIPCQSIELPYIISPAYTSKKREGDQKMVKLGSVVSLGQTCKQKFPTVTGFCINYGHLSKENPLKPIHPGALEMEEIENPSNWYRIETDNVVFLHILNGQAFTGYMENVKGQNFFLQGSFCRIIILGVNNSSGISPQYLAQALLSDKYKVRQQLLAADYYVKDFTTLKDAILKTYISLPSIANQNKTVVEMAVRWGEDNDREWKKKFEEYHKSIKERRHTLSQDFSGLRGSTERLIEYLKNYEGDFNLQANIDKKTTTVEDVISRIEARIKELGDQITALAEIESNFGESMEFNVIEKLRKITNDWQTDGIDVFEEEIIGSTDTDIRIEFPVRAFEQILNNIYFNVRRHGFTKDQQNKVIKLRWRLNGEMVIIRISNNGLPVKKTPSGYSSDMREGDSLDNSDHKSEKIGIRQSKDLMEEHKGEFSLDSIDEGDFKVAYTLSFKLRQ